MFVISFYFIKDDFLNCLELIKEYKIKMSDTPMTNEEQKQPTPARSSFTSKLKRASTAAPKDVVDISATSVKEEAKA